MQRLHELPLELVAEREPGDHHRVEPGGVRVARRLEFLPHRRRHVREVRVLQVGPDIGRLAHDVAKRDERRDHRDAGLLRHGDGLRDLQRVEGRHERVRARIVLAKERVNVFLGMGDGLPGGERRGEAGLAGDVADQDEALLLRLGRQRRVLGRADLVVDLDPVVARRRDPVDVLDRRFGSPRTVERRARRVDGRPEKLSVGDAPAPLQILRPTVQVEDGRHAVHDVEGQLLGRGDVDVHVGETRRQVAAAGVDDPCASGHRIRPRRSHGGDPAAGYDHGLIAQHPVGVHGHHVGVHERGDVGTAARKTDDRGEDQPEGMDDRHAWNLAFKLRRRRAEVPRNAKRPDSPARSPAEKNRNRKATGSSRRRPGGWAAGPCSS